LKACIQVNNFGTQGYNEEFNYLGSRELLNFERAFIPPHNVQIFGFQKAQKRLPLKI